MKSIPALRKAQRAICLFFSLLLAFSPATQITSRAQSPAAQSSSQTDAATTAATSESGFRLERMAVAGGSELLTIFGRLDGLHRGDDPEQEVPLVSVLRDTLGDSNPENDRLRYVWMLTYTEPSFLQRMAAAVPFLYNRAGDKGRAG